MTLIRELVLIGSGRVASQMANAFIHAGISIRAVYSRTPAHAAVLAKSLAVPAVTSLAEIPTDADAYIFAVSDSALPEMLAKMPAVNGVLMHTSGTVGLDVFPDRFEKTAVFYPLQTFSKEKPADFEQIPLLIESKKPAVFSAIKALAQKLSNKVLEANSEQRKQIHLSAVFVSNFPNLLFYIAQQLLQEKGLDFNVLKPLIAETAHKLDYLSPAQAQTGPALRRDEAVLQAHQEMLGNHPEWEKIYTLLSEEIKKIKS